MQFNSRIHLIASTGRWLGKISAEKAREHLTRQWACVDEQREGRVRAIRLVERAMPIKPPTPLTPASYLGQRYSYMETVRNDEQQVGRCFALKPINAEDGGLFGVNALADVCSRGCWK